MYTKILNDKWYIEFWAILGILKFDRKIKKKKKGRKTFGLSSRQTELTQAKKIGKLKLKKTFRLPNH